MLAVQLVYHYFSLCSNDGDSEKPCSIGQCNSKSNDFCDIGYCDMNVGCKEGKKKKCSSKYAHCDPRNGVCSVTVPIIYGYMGKKTIIMNTYIAKKTIETLLTNISQAISRICDNEVINFSFKETSLDDIIRNKETGVDIFPNITLFILSHGAGRLTYSEDIKKEIEDLKSNNFEVKMLILHHENNQSPMIGEEPIFQFNYFEEKIKEDWIYYSEQLKSIHLFIDGLCQYIK